MAPLVETAIELDLVLDGMKIALVKREAATEHLESELIARVIVR
jgi:hypothetical protein